MSQQLTQRVLSKSEITGQRRAAPLKRDKWPPLKALFTETTHHRLRKEGESDTPLLKTYRGV